MPQNRLDGIRSSDFLPGDSGGFLMDSDLLLQAGIVGDSPAMKALADQIEVSARGDLRVTALALTPSAHRCIYDPPTSVPGTLRYPA
jgi:hypothetical protein